MEKRKLCHPYFAFTKDSDHALQAVEYSPDRVKAVIKAGSPRHAAKNGRSDSGTEGK
jgi:hypothetical protein